MPRKDMAYLETLEESLVLCIENVDAVRKLKKVEEDVRQLSQQEFPQSAAAELIRRQIQNQSAELQAMNTTLRKVFSTLHQFTNDLASLHDRLMPESYLQVRYSSLWKTPLGHCNTHG